MTSKRKFVFVCFSLGLVVIFGIALFPLLARTSNCGGNSYALAACKQVVIYVQNVISTNDYCFDPASLDPSDRTNLFRIVNSHWTAGSGYWVRRTDPHPAANKHIIVVCDIAYENVPQPTIWNFGRRNPAHAVGFSDGTAGLISPAEFAQLDRNSFLNLNAVESANQP